MVVEMDVVGVEVLVKIEVDDVEVNVVGEVVDAEVNVTVVVDVMGTFTESLPVMVWWIPVVVSV